ncbi:diaminopimelate decarboxylase [Bordetella pseudohinzii]|uniref:Diaminopimelate decarboxylase n=1 Tax=Bordetella pseudohinzii TaxID=1331258 RepID=A0A0J6C6G0_9BORD|nr:diaminopimelate decarboxylase [Bordetella pseudohinzii]ANY18027.1 diaminopimelate decarboxylase [Bordetella pseudohinzii]KMM26311.1 diaminopimelate decarboxylase [Bordetella pseudohinzii]KXA75413.1 diaminopimelate decarboxylase [Bordetella pseudohinzii]KXA80880.1 diaminopimelate decarboxylase [Bordetella pseudohinzii]CUI81499.1 Diaminopimelate decarboxylase [Bordetella pseudohinzii]
MTAPSSQPQLAGHPYFHYKHGVLHAEGVALDILAAKLGTPLYVYSRAALHAAYDSYRQAIGDRPVLVCYGMKANSNLAVLKEFARLGAGFDIVSGGELRRVLAVGGDPAKIVFSGVGKQAWEMREALAAGVKCFNVESVAELHRLSKVAQAEGQVARVSLRVNPDVDAQTHPYISTGLKENKFGIAIDEALHAYQTAASLPGLRVVGVDCHIGSQLIDVSPYFDALDKLLDLIDRMAAQGIAIEHLDLGGGLGIRYTDEVPPSPKTLLDEVFNRLQARGYGHLHLVLEPGRSLVGNAGILLTTVQFLKHNEARNFAVVDAAMNDLLRPTLYQAYHGVRAVVPRETETRVYDVVGPVCESGDWLAKERSLAIEQDDVLALESAGAYGMVMAGNYNTRPRAAEVMVDGEQYHIVRQRESIEDLLRGESTLP